MIRRTMLAAVPMVLLAQCVPECADPSSSDGPQFEQELAAQNVVAGDCDSYVPLFNAYGLPSTTFKRIAWRESGCNHNSFVIDRDDAGGGLLGINLKGSLANVWYRWCGATLGNIRDPEINVRCASVAYQKMGLQPWS